MNKLEVNGLQSQGAVTLGKVVGRSVGFAYPLIGYEECYEI